MRVRNDGSVMWYSTFSGTNPESGRANMDRCFGLSYDHENYEVAVLMQSKADEMRVRSHSKGDFYDTVLMLLDMNGEPIRSTTISFNSVQYDTYLSN